MSEENKDNNTSSIDQVATVVAATNDDVSSSLDSALFGSSGSSAVASGGSIDSAGSSSSSFDLTSAGTLASAYSAGVMSALDQTYYAGALGRAAPAQTSALVSAAALTTRVAPPSQGKNTYIIDKSAAIWLDQPSAMVKADQAGHANVYYDNRSATGLSTSVVVGNAGTGAGATIYQQNGPLVISAGGGLRLTGQAQMWVGSGSTAGDIGLTYSNNENTTPLVLDSGTYLSATGYLGGVADKANAGTNLGAGQTNLRTFAVSTGDDVVMDIGGDWGTVGDYRTGYAAPKAMVGNNNKITTGGNVGVFMNASVTVGSNVTMSVSTKGGSGFFVGSGAYFSAGDNGSYYVHGGMGAAYSNTTLNTAARLSLGNNTSVKLDNANWGNFAAQAGAMVSAGSGFNLRALTLSVGYGQDPATGNILATEPAVMVIGDNAIIKLGQGKLPGEASGLIDNGSNFYLGSNGAIVLDAISGSLNIGANANITANNISIGNYTKDYSGFNPQVGSNMQYSWYRTGSNNQVTIGAGGTINLSGGIELDGNNGSLTLLGGTTSSYLNAGGISAGRFYREYNVAVSGSNYVYTNTSGANVNIGDGYVINLTAGTINTGLANDPTIINTGNVEINTSAGVFTFGNNITMNANSIVVGDYYLSTVNQYNGSTYTFTAPTGSSILTYGTGANIHLSGAVLLNGNSDKIIFGDNLILTAQTASFGAGRAAALATGATPSLNNAFSTGINANVTFSNGFIDNMSNGVVQFGDGGKLNILAGDLVFGGAGVGAGNRNWFHMGANNSLTLSGGSILITNTSQTFDFGAGAVINANSLSLAGTQQTFFVGANGNVNLSGGIINNATGGQPTTATGSGVVFGDSAKVTLGGNGLVLGVANAVVSNGNSVTMDIGGSGLVFNGAGYFRAGIGNTFTATGITFNTSANFIIGTGASVTVNGDILFGVNAGSTVFNIGANATLFQANNIMINAANPVLTFGAGIKYQVAGWNLNANNDKVVLGDGATGSIGNIIIGGNATGTTFNTGKAVGLTFGDVTLVNDSILTLNGQVSGTSLSMQGTTTVNIPASADVTIGSLAMDGSKQVTINVAAGATLNIGSLVTTNVGSTNIPKIVINGTGHVIIDGQKMRATSAMAHEAVFAGDNGIYQYTGTIQEASNNLTVTNFALTDQLIFAIGADYLDADRYVTSYANGVLTVSYVDAATGALTEVAHFNYTPATTSQAVPNVLIVPDASSTTGYNIIITKCFLTGTHILTPEGEVTVENLKAGDTVVTLQNGQQVSKQVVWAGHMDVNVNNYEQKDTLYPVRIKAHAFGLNQPCRDLLVTPEHTIYVDGGLIPARMLVNGRSIIVDTSMDRFTVYHIETEEHSILLSENLTTESYLNTDDRHLFNGDAVNLHLTFNENAGHQSWENDAAAPLTVARHQVEPIWQRLDRRATQQGYAPISKPEVTNDPALCLITQKGERLQPVDVKGNTYSFYVPANVSIVAMHSKAALPSEVVGPFLDDRRMLGVLVAQISVFGDGNLNILPADMTGLSGWHSAELNRTDRWTKGLATLPETVSEMSNKVKLIKIELTATSEYLVDTIEFAEKIA